MEAVFGKAHEALKRADSTPPRRNPDEVLLEILDTVRALAQSQTLPNDANAPFTRWVAGDTGETISLAEIAGIRRAAHPAARYGVKGGLRLATDGEEQAVPSRDSKAPKSQCSVGSTTAAGTVC